MLCSLLLPPVLPAAPVGKGLRTLGLSVQPAENDNYPHALAAAQAAGVQSVTLSLNWSQLETAPEHYDDTLLKIADGFYPPRHVQVDLILRPINTNRAEIPADLSGRSFDDPVVITRFKRLLDHVFAQIPHLALHSLVIGNEVDAFLGTSEAHWAQYEVFYRAACAYTAAKRPGLKVGVAATFKGLTGKARVHLQALNRVSGLIAVTYYPLNDDFTVRSPSAPVRDLARLCGLYPDRPLLLTEAGYPSSPACGSSEAKQASFIHSLFTAWDAHASQIISITLEWETDLSPAAVAEDVRYYGVSSNKFASFPGSLGLRTSAGTSEDKPAFTALREEAHLRGW